MTTRTHQPHPSRNQGGGSHGRRRGRGPTPKAEDRVYHPAYRRKAVAERRRAADPRAAAERRAARYVSSTDDLVFGRNAVLEALRMKVPATQLYLASHLEQDDRTRDIVRLSGAQGLNLLEADRLEMNRIARSGSHQGVILKVKPYEYATLRRLVDAAGRKTGAAPLFIALDGVTDPQNLGAVIRSAAAFSADGVILPERRSASVTAAAWKVSAGAAAHMPVARVVNLTRTLKRLKERRYYAVGLDGGGTVNVGDTGFEHDPLVVVLGSEGKGLSRLVRESCDAVARIPIAAAVESLNASVAAGIALYAVARARKSGAQRR